MENLLKKLLIAILPALIISGVIYANTVCQISQGCTGSSTASGARSNLGLGTIATQNVGTLTNTKYCTYATGTGFVCNSDGVGSMTYPGAGIALSTGSEWDTSITNNSANWNTAYGWGNHASAGYLTSASINTSSKLAAIMDDEDGTGDCGTGAFCIGGHTHSEYLTSLNGAVLTDQSTPQTIGLTGARLAKLWATDIEVTNAIAGSITGNAGTATALAADPADCAAGTVATAISASGDLTCGIAPLVSGGTLTSGYHCRYDGTGLDCDRVEDASGTCAANAVCMGGHTHPTTELSGVNAGTDLTADLEEETHASEHAVSAADTVFPADPGADRYLMWDDDPGALVWASPAGAGDVESVGDCTGGACLDGTSDGGTYISFYDAQGAGQLITGNLTEARTWTLPDSTGTLALTSSNITGTAAGLSSTLGPALGGTGIANNAANTITFTGNYGLGLTLSGATSLTLPTSGTIATLAGSETLTNKRITSRVGTITSSATPTPTGDDNDIYTITALAEAAAFAAPSGTPTNGQKLIIRIKDNGTPRTLSWNAIYRAGDIPLPTTTVSNKTMYAGFIYNSADSKWDFVSFVNNF